MTGVNNGIGRERCQSPERRAQVAGTSAVEVCATVVLRKQGVSGQQVMPVVYKETGAARSMPGRVQNRDGLRTDRNAVAVPESLLGRSPYALLSEECLKRIFACVGGEIQVVFVNPGGADSNLRRTSRDKVCEFAF